jgi:hypothetical protein
MINLFLLDINRHKTNIAKNITNLDHLHTYGNELYNGIIQYNKIYSNDTVFQTDKDNKLLKYIKSEPVPKKIDPKLKDIAIDVTGSDLQTQQQINLLEAPTGRNNTLAPVKGKVAPLVPNVKSPRDNTPATRKLQPVRPPSVRPRPVSPQSVRLLGQTKKNRGSLNTKQMLTENTWEQGEQ